MDNLTNGFDVYEHGNFATKKVFRVHTADRFVKDVKFAEFGATLVGGSDHGGAYIFDTLTGQAQDILQHGDKTQMVQALAVGCTYKKKRRPLILIPTEGRVHQGRALCGDHSLNR